MNKNDFITLTGTYRLTNDFSNICDLQEFFETLKFENGESYGYTRLATINTRLYEEHELLYNCKNKVGKKFNDTLLNSYGMGNMFFSVNSIDTNVLNRNIKWEKTNNKSFKKLQCNIECVSTLNCIVIDIDFKDAGNEWLYNLSDDEIIDKVKQVKNPTFIVKSGNGIHVYYNINNLYIGELSRPQFLATINRYKFCCQTIAKKFKMHGFITDNSVTGVVSKVIRLPFSYNIKDKTNPKRTFIMYKDLSVKFDLKEFYKKCIRLNAENQITQRKITKTNLNVTGNFKNFVFNDALPSDLSVPNTDYPRRNTKTTNFDIFLKGALDDILFLAKHKDYTGRRNMIMFHLSTVLNDKSWGSIDKVKYLNELNKYFNLPENELKSIINKEKQVKTSKQFLFKLMGVNQIDETYMKSLVISGEEKERRKKIQVQNANKKYNQINNAKRSEKAKLKKQEKIEQENNLIKQLLEQKLTQQQISDQTNFSIGKVKTIIKRLKNI